MDLLIAATLVNGLQIWENVGGYMYGQNRSPTNGDVLSSYVVDSAQIANIAQAAREFHDFVGGGNKFLGRVYVGPSRFEEFTLRLNSYNTYLVTWLAGLTSNTTTNSEWEQFTGRVDAAKITPKGIMISYQVTDRAGGSKRVANFVFPHVSLAINIADDNGAKVIDLIVSPFETSKAPTGESMSTVAKVASSDHYVIMSDNPLHWVTQVSDATDTTFNTIYKPVNTVVTINATKNFMAKNGAPTALTSMSSAGLATLAAAGTAGDKHVLQYEHQDFIAASA